MNLKLKKAAIIIGAFTLSSMTLGNEIKLSDLAGWQNDNLQKAWSGWENSCTALRKKEKYDWTKICDHSDTVNASSAEKIKEFFETNFKLVPIINKDGSTEGIITGYYEPLLQGSLNADDEYHFPIYSKPTFDSQPFLTRQQIESQPDRFKSDILLWTNNPYDLFFLHVQGSGRVQLKNDQQKSLVYAGNNGYEYTSIGKVLIGRGEMQRDKVSLQTLKNWLIQNPDKASEVLQQNKRYIFFNLVDTPTNETGPRGSLNVPLTPKRSIAIDPNHIAMGSPVWLETTLPSRRGEPKSFNRLMFAQDTGAAIKGQIRADVFFGRGEEAEYLAGNMNQKGKMYQLVPR